MDEMIEGTRLHPKRVGTHDAEVVMNREVVWRQNGFRSREEAQRAADRELATHARAADVWTIGLRSSQLHQA